MLTIPMLMITSKNIAENGEQGQERKEAFKKGENCGEEGRGSQSWADRAGLFYDLLFF